MKRLIFITMLISAAAAGGFAQKITRTPPVAPRNVPFKTISEISAADWQTLAATLEKEDWRQAAALAAQHLQSLNAENEKKQMAQLRYIYVFSLAGQILNYNTVGNSTDAEKVWTEVDKAMESFINKEFVMPPRRFTTDCQKKLNVICQVKDTPNAFRTTATNKEGSGIHLFDYVQLDEPADLVRIDGREAFLGGVLRRAEYNEEKSKPWVMRLFFNKGFLRPIVK